MCQTVQKSQSYKKIGNCLVFFLTDDLDHHMAKGFREISDTLIENEQVKNIIFDFKDVGFMDSSGIGMLMGRYKKVMFSGGRAAVTNVGEVVNRIFLLSGLYKIIDKYDTVDEALEQLLRVKKTEE